MREFIFLCEVCQGEEEPCKLIATLEGEKCNPPETCPFDSGISDWRSLEIAPPEGD